MYLMRVSLPDTPGKLGAVASVLGMQGADITSVQIVGRDQDTVIDDFLIELTPGRLPDQVVSACQAVPGVRVDWIAFYPEGAGLESDLEALDQMMRDPENAGEVLAGAAVAVFHVHWAVLVGNRSTRPRSVFATPRGPDLSEEQLRALGSLDAVQDATPDPTWLPGWQDVVIAVAPVPGDRAVILGRQGGPSFLSSELARFGHLAALVPH